MKKAFNLQLAAVILLTFAISFTSCETKKETPKTIATAVIPSEELTEIPTYREPLVFIAGKDNSNFYKNAKKYYEEKQYEVITDALSLQEIITWLNNNFDDRLYTDIYIVSKSNPWKGMQLETNINSGNLTLLSLEKALLEDTLPTLITGITEETNIIFNASSVGDNKELLTTLKAALSTEEKSPKIIASPYITVFGDRFSSHNLAKAYYGFYPTAHSPGKVDLSKEFAKKYPNEEEIEWYDALNNETERFVGEAYTTQFNLPIKMEIDLSNSDNETPILKSQEAIMDFIETNDDAYLEFETYNIPIEKFRWKAYIKNDHITIKGITTVLSILKPLIKPYGDLEHIEPETDNLRLYTVK